MYHPTSDALRSGDRRCTSAAASCEIISMPPSMIVGAAIRAARRGASPSVLASLASDLEALAEDGDCVAPFVLTWFRARSGGSAEDMATHEEAARG